MSILDGTLLLFGRDLCEAGGTLAIDVDPSQFRHREVALQWASDVTAFDGLKERLMEGVNAIGIPNEALSILIIAQATYLKHATILLNLPLPRLDALNMMTVLSTEQERASEFECAHHGFTVAVYLLLNRDIPMKPLRPSRRGTWLAATQFRVSTKLDWAIFRPHPLDDELRRRFDLPPRTIRFVVFDDHDPLAPYTDQASQPTFYVDKDLLAEVHLHPRSDASRAIQMQLVLDFISAVVQYVVRTGELSDLALKDVERSLVGSIMKLAAGAGATEAERAQMFEYLKSRPELVVAYAEHSANLRKGLIANVKDGD